MSEAVKNNKGFAVCRVIPVNHPPDFEIISLNKQFAEYFGKSKPEMEKIRFSILAKENNILSSIFTYEYTRVLSNNEELTFRIKAEHVHFSVYAFRISDKVFSIILNEASRSENELRSSEAHLIELTDKLLQTQKLAKVGSVEFYPDSEKVIWSDTVFEIFEINKSNGPLKLIETLHYIHPDDIENARAVMTRAVRNRERCDLEFRLVVGTGKLKYIRYVFSPIYDENGKYIKRLGAVTDITEIKSSQLQLEEAYKEKEVLLRELYHRTKNNMQLISSLLNLKSSAMSNPEVEEVFSDMQKRIRAIALVHEKLYQSQNLSRVNLNEYIRELVQLLHAGQSGDKNISIKFDLAEINVLIDTAVPLGLIITELVVNSLKYAFPADTAGYIEIVLKRTDDGEIVLKIVDTGVGFDVSKIEKEEKLGLQLVRSIGESQLRGKVILTVNNGVSWEIKFTDSLYKERV